MPTAPGLNESPDRVIWNWGVTYKDEPRQGAPSVHVSVWMSAEVAAAGMVDIADCLEARTDWKVLRNGGWSTLSGGELTLVIVKVRTREIRAALARSPVPRCDESAAAADGVDVVLPLEQPDGLLDGADGQAGLLCELAE